MLATVSAVLALTLSVAATSFSGRASDSVVHLPLTKINNGASTSALVAGQTSTLSAANRARAASLKTKFGKKSTTPKTITASNWQYFQYVTSVGIGSPATYYNLVVDTGSSNTFTGTGKAYVKTKTTIPTGQNVSVVYGTGFFSGVEYLDQVTLADNFVIHNQSVGDALENADFAGVDGIIGVGPQFLTIHTLSPNVNATIPTVTDNALAQGLISTEVLGISFNPTLSNDSANGALTFGGVDSSKYIGEISYVPVTTTEPSSFYWGINVTKLQFGSTTIIHDSDAGIVDTGTTQVLLADDFFQTYSDAIPGSVLSNTSGLLEIPESSLSSVKSLDFTIGSVVYSLAADAQILPQADVVPWGGEKGHYYSVVGPLGSPSGEGFDHIIGQKFLERFYSVFDTANNRVGFAYTENTYSNL